MTERGPESEQQQPSEGGCADGVASLRAARPAATARTAATTAAHRPPPRSVRSAERRSWAPAAAAPASSVLALPAPADQVLTGVPAAHHEPYRRHQSGVNTSGRAGPLRVRRAPQGHFCAS